MHSLNLSLAPHTDIQMSCLLRPSPTFKCPVSRACPPPTFRWRLCALDIWHRGSRNKERVRACSTTTLVTSLPFADIQMPLSCSRTVKGVCWNKEHTVRARPARQRRRNSSYTCPSTATLCTPLCSRRLHSLCWCPPLLSQGNIFNTDGPQLR